MLHEILLSLSGHPSPLLTADHTSPTSIFSPPEKALLSSLAHLSLIHRKLIASTASVAASHPSSICRAVANSISFDHLERFQQKILEVERTILRKDAGLVGAYDIVPLTAVVGHFDEWTRRMEWFLEIMEFMMAGQKKERQSCTGAMIIDRLCGAMKTGYTDIEEAALSLVKVAETAWLKQTSAWILYGRLPSFGKEDFFVDESDEGVSYVQKIRKSILIFCRNMKSRTTYSLHSFPLPQLHHCCLLDVPSIKSKSEVVQACHLWICRPFPVISNSYLFSRSLSKVPNSHELLLRFACLCHKRLYRSCCH